jgi:hypothetical protein
MFSFLLIFFVSVISSTVVMYIYSKLREVVEIADS